MTISRRILLLIAAAVIGLIVLSGSALVQTKRVFSAANYGNENVVPSVLALSKIEQQFMALRIRLYRHLLSSDAKEKAEVDQSLVDADKNIQKGFADYQALLSDDKDREYYNASVKRYAEYQQQLQPVLELSRQHKNEEAIKSFEGMRKVAQTLQVALEDHMKYNEELGVSAAGEARQVMSSSNWISAMVTLAVIVIVAVMGFSIRSNLNRRLREANQMADRISSGDLSTRNQPALHGNDEASLLIQSMEKMRADLASIVSRIANTSNHLAASATELSATAVQVSSSSQNQAGATASSAAALEQLTVSIDHVGSSADDVCGSADTAGNAAQQSGEDVRAAATLIGKVSESTEETAKQIQMLSAKVQEIGSITSVIREVADQTNLLALNAAIEAARAGEQGRGFAVVADEVRKLAERTTLSVKEISDVIGAIQQSTASSVTSMQNNRDMVSHVAVTAQEASNAMDGIRQATRTLQEGIGSISEAMREQRSASAELSRNVELVAQMSEENSTAVASVAKTANELVAISDGLKSEISRFQL